MVTKTRKPSAPAPQRRGPKAKTPTVAAPAAAKAAAEAEKPVTQVATASAPPAAPIAASVAAVEPETSPTAEATSKVVEEMATQAKTTETLTNEGKAMFDQAGERTREAIDQGVKAFEEISSFARGNVEAFVAAGRAAAQGFETLTQTATDYSRKSIEDTQAAIRTLSSAKTPNEFFQLQSDFARTQFDNGVAEMSRFSETFLKLVGEVFEPISNRVAVATDRLGKVGAPR